MAYDYTVYFQQLHERVDSAVKVPFRDGVTFNGWEPKMNDCHGNVDFWVRHHSESTAVRGWLFWPAMSRGGIS